MMNARWLKPSLASTCKVCEERGTSGRDLSADRQALEVSGALSRQADHAYLMLGTLWSLPYGLCALVEETCEEPLRGTPRKSGVAARFHH